MFAVVVAALVGLGIYMLVPGAPGARGRAAAASRSVSPPAPTPDSASPAAPTATPRGRPSTGATSAPDIYRWLPFSPSDLARAATVAADFGDAYGTYSYTEHAAAYVSSMRRLITPALSQILARGYAAPGLASQRTSHREVSTGSAAIDSLRAFGTSSLTFVVTISQRITGTGTAAGRSSAQYAVTVTRNGTGWLVSDIELASAGNQ